MKIAATIITVLIIFITTTVFTQAGLTESSPARRSSAPGGSSSSGDDTRDTGRGSHAARPTSPSSSSRIKQKTVIKKITTTNNCLKKKSVIIVKGSYLKSGDVKCSAPSKISLKQTSAKENELLYKLTGDVETDKRYTVKCSNKKTSKAQTFKVCPQRATRTPAIGKKPPTDEKVDLQVSKLQLTGKTKEKTGEEQSFRLTIKNGAKPGPDTSEAPRRQQYTAKIFLARTNLCNDWTAADNVMSYKTLVKKELPFTTIPINGRTETKMLTIPLPDDLKDGDHFWHAFVDSTYKVKESKEYNNLFCLTDPIRIVGKGGLPDRPEGTVPYSLDKPLPQEKNPVPMPKPPLFATCDGLVPTIKGDNGDNTLLGTSGKDIIHGMGGNDTIHGNGGDDIICGGNGNDLIKGGPGNDKIYGNASDATSTFANCNKNSWSPTYDQLLGGPGDDILVGGPGTDCVFGEDGNDTIIGAEHLDTMIGGSGDDMYLFTNSGFGSATVIEDPNADTDTFDFSNFPTPDGIYVSLYSTTGQVVESGQLTLNITSESGIENLIGTPFRDTLNGNSRDNLIKGGDSPVSNYTKGLACSLGNTDADILEGREGNDTLLGEDGSDVLWGEFAYDYDGNNGPPGLWQSP